MTPARVQFLVQRTELDCRRGARGASSVNAGRAAPLQVAGHLPQPTRSLRQHVFLRATSRAIKLLQNRQREVRIWASNMPGIFSFMMTPRQADSQCPWIAWNILAAASEI